MAGVLHDIFSLMALMVYSGWSRVFLFVLLQGQEDMAYEKWTDG